MVEDRIGIITALPNVVLFVPILLTWMTAPVAGQRHNNGVVFSLGSVPRLSPRLTTLMALLGSSDATVFVR
jgi:hypothetical protein